MLAGAASSQAAVTIGPDLASLTPNAAGGFNCNNAQQCTVVNGSVGAGFGSGIVNSPVTGSITHVRIRVGPKGAGQIGLRLLHTGPTGYTGGSSFGALPPNLAPNAITDLTGNFPIQAGDAIGVTCCEGGADAISSTSIAGSGSLLTWGVGSNPPLGVGETRPPDFTSHSFMLMLNADIEPTNQFSLGKPKLSKGKIKDTATVSNPGTLASAASCCRSGQSTQPRPGPCR